MFSFLNILGVGIGAGADVPPVSAFETFLALFGVFFKAGLGWLADLGTFFMENPVYGISIFFAILATVITIFLMLVPRRS